MNCPAHVEMILEEEEEAVVVPCVYPERTALSNQITISHRSLGTPHRKSTIEFLSEHWQPSDLSELSDKVDILVLLCLHAKVLGYLPMF